MSNFIEIQTQPGPTAHGQQLLAVVNAAASLYQQLELLKARMGAFAYGDDNAAVEAAYGLPAGTGADVVALVNNTHDLLEGGGTSAFMQLIGRMGV